MSARVGTFFRHPVVIILPCVALGLLVWNFYLDHVAGVPSRAQHNLLPNGGFDELDKDKRIVQWRALPSNHQFAYQLTPLKSGFFSASSLRVEMFKGRESGTLSLRSAQVPVQTGKGYLFKGSYRTALPIKLQVEYVYRSGKIKVGPSRQYGPAEEWSSVSQAFRAPKDVAAVRVLYQMPGPGRLQVDNSYLEQRNDDVLISAKPVKHGDLKPMVSIVVDGGRKATVLVAQRMLEWNHLPATFYVDPTRLGSLPTDATQADIKQLATGGQEIAVFAGEDPTVLSSHGLKRRFGLYAGFLKDQWGKTRLDYAAADDRDDAEVLGIVPEFFRSRRGSVEGLNTAKNFDPYNLRVVTVASDTGTDRIQELLGQAKDQKAWLILRYQGVEDGYGPAVGPMHFSDQLTTIAKSDVPVRTVEQALRQLGIK